MLVDKRLLTLSRHTIVCHAAKYSQYGGIADKSVIYRNQENTVFTHASIQLDNATTELHHFCCGKFLEIVNTPC